VLYEDFAAREALVELRHLIAPNEFEVRRTEELAESLHRVRVEHRVSSSAQRVEHPRPRRAREPLLRLHRAS
jgi:hypothetical protein